MNHTPLCRVDAYPDKTVVMLLGCWQAHHLAHNQSISRLGRELLLYQGKDVQWDLSGLIGLDHMGAQVIWDGWRQTMPSQVVILPEQVAFFKRIQAVGNMVAPKELIASSDYIRCLGSFVLEAGTHGVNIIRLLGQLALDVSKIVRHPSVLPAKEISADIFHMGWCALGITALVGMLIGIVLSYLSAEQLRLFGGDIYLVNILGLSIIRELGPLLAAILVAGRSGSAVTASLGVMRVTEELDAMLVMGIPHGLRLVLPKVLALAILMPLLVIWTDIMALTGGMLSAYMILDMSPSFFIYKLPDAVEMINFYIGLLKGCVFGVAIALIACYFGLHIKPNTASLAKGTTASVVGAITTVIILDAIFAIVFRHVGY